MGRNADVINIPARAGAPGVGVNLLLRLRQWRSGIRSFAIDRILSMMLVALRLVVRTDAELRHWHRKTWKTVPDLRAHFIQGCLNPFLEEKIRFLLAAQLKIVGRCVKRLHASGQTVTLADIGDSDGSLRMTLQDEYPAGVLDDVGINLQPTAVERLRSKGLKAILADATALPDGCGPYHVVTVLETLEHLPNPVLFLERAQNLVKDYLVISVPYVAKSRVALDYLSDDRWDHRQRKATIESVHVFELSPEDWGKLFAHCGWKVIDDFVALQYPKSLTLPLRRLWKRIDFEGFYCAALAKDESKRALFLLE
jgi:hypothetical protein